MSSRINRMQKSHFLGATTPYHSGPMTNTQLFRVLIFDLEDNSTLHDSIWNETQCTKPDSILKLILALTQFSNNLDGCGFTIASFGKEDQEAVTVANHVISLNFMIVCLYNMPRLGEQRMKNEVAYFLEKIMRRITEEVPQYLARNIGRQHASQSKPAAAGGLTGMLPAAVPDSPAPQDGAAGPERKRNEKLDLVVDGIIEEERQVLLNTLGLDYDPSAQ